MRLYPFALPLCNVAVLGSSPIMLSQRDMKLICINSREIKFQSQVKYTPLLKIIWHYLFVLVKQIHLFKYYPYVIFDRLLSARLSC